MKRYKVVREVPFSELRKEEFETYQGYKVPPGASDYNKEILDLLEMEHVVKVMYQPGIPAEISQELTHIIQTNAQIVAISPQRGTACTVLVDLNKVEATYIGEEPVNKDKEEKGPPPS